MIAVAKYSRANRHGATSDMDYTAEELDFLRAMDKFRTSNHVQFPSLRETLRVIRSLGYSTRHRERILPGLGRKIILGEPRKSRVVLRVLIGPDDYTEVSLTKSEAGALAEVLFRESRKVRADDSNGD